MFQFLLGVPHWVALSFPWIRSALFVIIALMSIVMVIGILASPAQAGRGQNAITGASESYYTKHKGRSNQGRIRTLIIVSASIIALCAILYFVSWQIVQNVQAPY